MANDIIDINVYETNDSVAITVQPNLTTVNITQINAGNGNVPVGGTAGQVLAKIDSANFNTQWVNQSGGGGGISDAPNDANAYVRSALSWVIGYTKSAIDTLLGNKVDKVTGKGLSTEDYTSTEKSKLAGIEAGAEVNVNADWNATSGDAQILNKPTIPTATSDITNDGADGVNPFITALDIPTAGQAGTIVREVKNMTGATLTKGTVVYISGANGSKALVSKALATTDALSARTFGLLQSNILNNGLGYCVIIGDLSGLDTSSFAEGDQLYLSGVTAGTYTASKVLAPTHLVYVGKVTRVHATQGQIEVGIQNGYELEEIHDCQIITPTNNQLLVYESASDLWKNKTIGIQQILDNGNTTETGVTFNPPSESSAIQINLANDSSNAIGIQTDSTLSLVNAISIANENEEIFNVDNIGNVTAKSIIKDGGTSSQFLMADGSVSSGGTPPINAYSFLANNTNASATPTEQTFENLTNQTYSGAIVWTGGSAPSGTTEHTYSLSQIGNLVTLIINLSYGTAGGATLTSVACELPSTAPTPSLPTSVSSVGEVINYGSGLISALKTANTVFNSVALRIKSTGVYEVAVTRTVGVAAKQAYITIQYFV